MIGFADAVDALYGAIDLPAPLRSELADGRLALSVGDAELLLEAVGARDVLVRAPLDTLHVDPVAREREAAEILRDALALAASNVAAVSLEPGVGGAPPLAWAEALVGLEGSRAAVGQSLKRAIEDVVEHVERHAERSGDGRTAPRGEAMAPPSHGGEAGHLIFRP